MKIFGRELQNPLASKSQKQAEPAINKITEHVSTSRAFEDRQAGVINCWVRINSSALPLADKFVSGQFVGGRVTWAKILFNTFLAPYVDTAKDPFLDRKFKAMTIKFANWDRHWRSLRRNSPDDLETQELDFEMHIVAPLTRVASLCWPKELAKSQDNFFYQEQPSFGNADNRGNSIVDPELKAALLKMKDDE